MNKRIIKTFDDYVKTYDLEDESIKRKYEHSLRVMKISNKLAKKLKLSVLDIELAGVIGLLHDYGRFTQWNKYHTFNDIDSVDHGDLGVKLLFDDKEIEKYYSNIEDYDLIEKAIKYHNKYEDIKNVDRLTKIHSDIIRDADKLDIFYIFAKGIAKIEEDNLETSKKCEKDFFNKKLINRSDIKNKSDEILLILGMVFELNHRDSVKCLYKKKYIWKIYKGLNNKERYLNYFKYADSYLKERIKKNVRKKI